jgi:DNA-binding transcriptional MocR family regulator
MPEPVLTARQKFDWYDATTFDPILSHVSVRVAHAIGAHLNKWTGSTFPSHAYLAKRLDVSTKTIERAVRQLEERGYLSVTRSPGRGYANVYRAVVGDGESSGDLVTAEESPTVLSEKPDSAVQETRQRCRPYPSSLPNSITHKTDNPLFPPAATKVQVHQEPEIVRQARLQEQGEQTRIEAVLADRLTTGHDINGREVLLNTGPQELAILTHRLRHDELTPDDIAKAQATYRALRERGMALELISEWN